MGYDLLTNTYYKGKRPSVLIYQLGVGGGSLSRTEMQTYILKELLHNNYPHLSVTGKHIISTYQVIVNNADDLAQVIRNGWMKDNTLLRSHIEVIEDLIPFMDDDLVESIQGELEEYYVSLIETDRLLVRYNANNTRNLLNSKKNLAMEYFIYRTQSRRLKELNDILTMERGPVYTPESQLIPIGGKQEVLGFLRSNMETYTDMRYYLERIVYDEWELSQSKLESLYDYFKTDMYLAPSYVIRNGFLQIPTVHGMLKVLDNFSELDPSILKANKGILDQRLGELVKHTSRKLNNATTINSTQLSRRVYLIQFMMYLTIHGVGQYGEWIDELKFKRVDRGNT